MKNDVEREGALHESPMNRGLKHDFKTLSLRLNKWEDVQLTAAAEETGRTKSCFIRWAIREQAKKVL